MKLFIHLVIISQLLSLAVSYIPPSDWEGSQIPDEGDWDSLDQFTYVGSGPCRVENLSNLSEHTETYTAGTLADCADKCIHKPHCNGIQYRYTDDKVEDCAVFLKLPTHVSEPKDDRYHECYSKNKNPENHKRKNNGD